MKKISYGIKYLSAEYLLNNCGHINGDSLTFSLSSDQTESATDFTQTLSDNILFRQIALDYEAKWNSESIMWDTETVRKAVTNAVVFLDFSDVKMSDDKEKFVYPDGKKFVDKTTNIAVKELLKNGFELELPNDGKIHYVRFEKSSSMSRNKLLSFIREDIRDEIAERIYMGITPEKVLLAKLYAYRGLVLSGGTCIENDKLSFNGDTVAVINDIVLDGYISPDGIFYAVRKNYDRSHRIYSLGCFTKRYFLSDCDNRIMLRRSSHKGDDIQIITTDDLIDLSIEKKQLAVDVKNKKADVYFRFENNTIIVSTIEAEESWHDKKINVFDGEGIICPEYAEYIRESYGIEKDGYQPGSFQIRLPYVKGMLHEVDFHGFAEEILKDDYNNCNVTDIFGVEHKLSDLRIILTKSMFKAYGWIHGNKAKAIERYWNLFNKYDHRLFVVNVGREPNNVIMTNYQVIGTSSLTNKDFNSLLEPSINIYKAYKRLRLKDDSDYVENAFNILTTGENAFLPFSADIDFCEDEDGFDEDDSNNGESGLMVLLSKDLSVRQSKIEALKIKKELIGSQFIKNLLDEKADSVIKQIAQGRFPISGQNRFLSADLLYFLFKLIRRPMQEPLPRGHIYAPDFTEKDNEEIVVYRNPHITHFEYLKVKCIVPDADSLRARYLGRLESVVFIDFPFSNEKLGGADYDGDRVFLSRDERFNACVRRSEIAVIDPIAPAAEVEPNRIDEIYKNLCLTFDNRVGQYSNRCFTKTVEYYNANSNGNKSIGIDDIKIYTKIIGQEIDSAKLGKHPENISKALPKSKEDVFLSVKDLAKKSKTLTAKDIEEAIKETKAIITDDSPNLHQLSNLVKELLVPAAERIKSYKAFEGLEIKETKYYDKAEKLLEAYEYFKNKRGRENSKKRLAKDKLNKKPDKGCLQNVLKIADFYYDTIPEEINDLIELFVNAFQKDKAAFIEFNNFANSEQWFYSNPIKRTDIVTARLKVILGENCAVEETVNNVFSASNYTSLLLGEICTCAKKIGVIKKDDVVSNELFFFDNDNKYSPIFEQCYKAFKKDTAKNFRAAMLNLLIKEAKGIYSTDNYEDTLSSLYIDYKYMMRDKENATAMLWDVFSKYYLDDLKQEYGEVKNND